MFAISHWSLNTTFIERQTSVHFYTQFEYSWNTMSCDVWLAVVLWRLIGCYENQNVENGLRDTVDRSCDMLSVEVCQVWVWVSSKGSRCCLSKNRYHHWSVLVGFRNINGFMADLHKCWICFPYLTLKAKQYHFRFLCHKCKQR